MSQPLPSQSLAAWLATRTPEQLASILTRRSAVFYGREHRTLEELADWLISSASGGRGSLTAAGHQVLAAAAGLAVDAGSRAVTAVPRWGQQVGQLGSSGGTVMVEELLHALGAGPPGAIRDAAGLVLDEVQGLALLWPLSPQTLVVPGSVRDLYRRPQGGTVCRLDEAMTASFGREPVAVIAEALGVGGPTDARTSLQSAIVAHLSDATNVRKLLDGAPAEAHQHLDVILDNGGVLLTKVFLGHRGPLRWEYSIVSSYADPHTLWLAQRGLILPTGPDRAEVPVEVSLAVRDSALFALTPQPEALPQVAVAAEQVRGEAQTALAGAVVKIGRLLEALDQQPIAPRKAGGLPVQQTRRLAKIMGLSETETRFWIGIADYTGLIGLRPDRDGPVLCPSELSDHWLESVTPVRLTMLLQAWLTVADVITWWPVAGETPIAYVNATDLYASWLRMAVLQALATLPPDRGCLQATPVVSSGQAPSAEAVSQVGALTRVAAWLAPLVVDNTQQSAQRVLYTVYEAELLGVVAHGALTAVGQALLAGGEPPLRAAVAALLPAEQKTARFQADMTVVVTGIPSGLLAGLLGSVADRESHGQAVVYRISAESIRRALDAGATAADLLAQLTEMSDGELPQALVYLVNDVARAHGKMRVVRSACCIRCDDAATIAELAAAKGLAKLGLRQIAPTVLVSGKPPTETLAMLRSAGYSPTLEATTGTTVVERARPKRSIGRTWRPPQTTSPAVALALARRLLA